MNIITVNYSSSENYRKDIGKSLYLESLKFNSTAKTILEIGPGMGEIALEFFNNDPSHQQQIIFVEPNLEYANLLSVRFPKSLILAQFIEKAVFESKDLPNNLDIIIANFSLHWVEGIIKTAKALFEHLNAGGILAVANTDFMRSFWGRIDAEVKNHFPECSLFNIEQSHSMSANQWEGILTLAGFKLLSKVSYHGTAAIFPSAKAGFDDFKKMTGCKYLKLAPGITCEDVESFVYERLADRTDSSGNFEINASGFRLILQKRVSKNE